MHNEIKQVLRKKRSEDENIKQYQENNAPKPFQVNTEDTLAIKDEIKRLQTILRMFNGEYIKITLALKVYFRLAVKEQDFKAYNKRYKRYPYNRLLNLDDTSKDIEIHEELVGLFNFCEQKNKKKDSVGMYIEKRIKQILYRLNGDPPEHDYTKETFKILFEYYNEML